MLKLTIAEAGTVTQAMRAEILSMCSSAYDEDLTKYFQAVGPATHVLGYVDSTLASHAMWVTRWLQAGDGPFLQTAYVEVVATLSPFRRRGYATQVMRRLASEIPECYDVAALCPAFPEVYARLGWQFWRGPLAIRTPSGHHRATPEEQVMVLALPGRPVLDLDAPLSAEWREGELW